MKKTIAFLGLLFFGIVTSYADEAYVYIRRPGNYIGCALPVQIDINGGRAYSLPNGKNVRIAVPAGKVVLEFKHGFMNLDPISVTLDEGESLYLVAEIGKMKPTVQQDIPLDKRLYNTYAEIAYNVPFSKVSDISNAIASGVSSREMANQIIRNYELQLEASASEKKERDSQTQPEYGTLDYIPTKEGSKWGYKQLGNWVIEPRFESAGSFSEGLACVKLMGKWGYIKKDGEMAIPFKYENALDFSEGLAPVMLMNKWGYIDDGGNTIIPFKYAKAQPFEKGLAAVNDGLSAGFINKDCEWYDTKSEVMASFKGFTKQYVETKVNEWQQKGKYEKTDAWKARVTDENRKKMIDKLVAEATDQYIAAQSKNISTTVKVCDYDADNEVFLINDSKFGNLLVPVPINEAEYFSNNFDSYTRKNVFRVDGDGIGLAEMHFTNEDKTYSYKNTASLQFSSVDIDYAFETVDFDIEAKPSSSGKQVIGSRSETALAKSDVDTNIPTAGIKSDNTFAVIIANENYRREKEVEYALNDGKTFCEYCKQTLGIPEKNIRICTDATFLDMKAEIDWLTNISRMYGGDARLMFYYAGHGIPDEGSKDAYLLPVDGMGSNPSTGYKLSDLYASLGESNSKSSVVFLDACFSGAQRNGEMMASARGVAIKAKAAAPKGNMVVLSAATGDETAYPYYEKGHGMFTYFLLKKLQETKGQATLGEIADYVTTQVGRKSIVENSKSQTPTATASASLEDDWKTMKLF